MEKHCLFVAGQKINQMMVIEARTRMAIEVVQSLEARVKNSAGNAKRYLTGPNIMGTQRQRLRATITATMTSGVFLVAFWIYFHAGKRPQNQVVFQGLFS
jgi:hypothetical protein